MQALNRYSYVENNPLSYTDPSGYFLKKAFKKLGKAVKKAWKGIRTGVQSILVGIGKALNSVPYLSTAVGIAIYLYDVNLGKMYFDVLAGLNASVSLANGASIGDVATGMAVGAIASGYGNDLGNAFSGAGAGVAGHYVAGGLAGGVAAKAMGGSFKDGFSGGLAGAVARHSMGAFTSQPAQEDITHAKMSQAVYDVTDADIGSLKIYSYTLDSIYTDDSGIKQLYFWAGNPPFWLLLGQAQPHGPIGKRILLKPLVVVLLNIRQVLIWLYP